MLKTTEETIGAKYSVCQKTSTKEGRNQFRWPSSHKYLLLHCPLLWATTGRQWSQCYMQQTET